MEDFSVTEDEKRKILIQRKLSELREYKKEMEDFNTKYDLSEFDISLALSIRKNLQSIKKIIQDIDKEMNA